MYPTGELRDLAEHKRHLRRRIAARREECAVMAARLARPLHLLEAAAGWWRRVSPLLKLGAIPLGFALSRRFRPGPRLAGRSLLRWLPLVFRLVALFRARGRGAEGRS